jgi:hypothetical protein
MIMYPVTFENDSPTAAELISDCEQYKIMYSRTVNEYTAWVLTSTHGSYFNWTLLDSSCHPDYAGTLKGAKATVQDHAYEAHERAQDARLAESTRTVLRELSDDQLDVIVGLADGEPLHPLLQAEVTRRGRVRSDFDD